MQTYAECDLDGRHYRFVYDEVYETVGSYAYDTEEETKAAEDEEIRNLKSGKWVVLGCIVTEPCQSKEHCAGCSKMVETGSLWGIVVESSQPIEQIVKEHF